MLLSPQLIMLQLAWLIQQPHVCSSLRQLPSSGKRFSFVQVLYSMTLPRGGLHLFLWTASSNRCEVYSTGCLLFWQLYRPPTIPGPAVVPPWTVVQSRNSHNQGLLAGSVARLCPTCKLTHHQAPETQENLFIRSPGEWIT